jgi:hypothetical protein
MNGFRDPDFWTLTGTNILDATVQLLCQRMSHRHFAAGNTCHKLLHAGSPPDNRAVRRKRFFIMTEPLIKERQLFFEGNRPKKNPPQSLEQFHLELQQLLSSSLHISQKGLKFIFVDDGNPD